MKKTWRLKPWAKTTVEITILVLLFLAIGFAGGVEFAETLSEILRGFILSMGCYYCVFKLSDLLEEHAK